MRRSLPIALAFLVALSVTHSLAAEQPKQPTESVEKQGEPADKKKDPFAWRSMFDGKSLDGWQGNTDGYQATDGILVCTKQGGRMQTAKSYGNTLQSLP